MILFGINNIIYLIIITYYILMVTSPLHTIIEENSNQSSEAAFMSYNTDYEEFKQNEFKQSELQDNSSFTLLLKGIIVFTFFIMCIIIILFIYYNI
jgi:small-conductance mechanosensitive channel